MQQWLRFLASIGFTSDWYILISFPRRSINGVANGEHSIVLAAQYRGFWLGIAADTGSLFFSGFLPNISVLMLVLLHIFRHEFWISFSNSWLLYNRWWSLEMILNSYSAGDIFIFVFILCSFPCSLKLYWFPALHPEIILIPCFAFWNNIGSLLCILK